MRSPGVSSEGIGGFYDWLLKSVPLEIGPHVANGPSRSVAWCRDVSLRWRTSQS